MIQAAQYLRASTEHQQYSTANQRAAIAEYAVRNKLMVVKTYSDDGKSGVVLKRRSGLSQLLRDVIAGQPGFAVILVYDVSRWGRFQDDDEAACYEFLCRRSGVQVRYCEEAFSNDGSVTSTILKNLRRATAAEFSRELGRAVFTKKAAVVKRGFWVGGPAPYGMQRMLVSKDSSRNRLLRPGQYKGVMGDRVVLVPGPADEVRCIQRMFALATKGQMGATAISRELDKLGLNNRGQPWIPKTISRMLESPVYAGFHTWNRSSRRLSGPLVRVSPEQWIQTPNAFAPIVTQQTFAKAQSAMQEFCDARQWTPQRVLAKLQHLFATKHKVTLDLLYKTPGMPDPTTVKRHLGSIKRACELVGYSPPPLVVRRANGWRLAIQLRAQLIERLKRLLPRNIEILNQHLRYRIHFPEGATVSVSIARGFQTENGEPRWAVIPIQFERDNPTLLCRANIKWDGFHSFYLFPRIDLPSYHRIVERDPWLNKGVTLKDLSHFYDQLKILVSSADPCHSSVLPPV